MASSAFVVESLQCEYQVDPLAIDTPRPRLSWMTTTSQRNWKQAAYQILIATSADALKQDRADLWDSGKVTSSASTQIEYAGKALSPQQAAYWKVRVWADGGGESTSATAFWEAGLPRGEWRGKWIGSSIIGGPRTSSPSPYLRKNFSLPDRPIRRARLYATALGIYEASINGKRVGNDVFRPGWTEYAKRVQYNVYDVTAMLAKGSNVIGAVLGDGWYCGRLQALPRQQYGDRPRLLAQLYVEFADGTSEWIATDPSWRTSPGPILGSDMIGGEHFDARLEIAGWNTPSFNDAEWQPVKTFADPGIAIVASVGPPVRAMAELKPIAPPTPCVGLSWGYRGGGIYDLGQNMVGVVRIKVRAKAGVTIRLRHGEMLEPNGALYTANLRSAEATDFYTCRGDEAGETWEPRFTFHGFRYVELSAQGDFEVLPDGVTGVVMHSDTPPTGTFECSDPLLNQLQKNIQWGQRGNFLEVPTDCPQRDERLGWTGDAQVFIRTAAFNMNVAGFFNKWQQDITDSQHERGSIPMVIPNAGTGADGGAAWADAAVICPWTIYQCYGDKRILADHYDSLAKFIAFLDASSSEGLRGLEAGAGLGQWINGAGPTTVSNPGFGDWLALDGSGKVDGGTPKDLISTAFFSYSSKLMSRIAAMLGKEDDAKKYHQLSDRAKTAFQNRYVTPAGIVAAQTQTSYVLALHFDLLPDHLRPAAADLLVKDIKKRGNHLATGFVGTPYLCEVLTRFGYLDVAYVLLNQKTWPSWLYSVTQGATTIWERWNGWTKESGFADIGMNSYNHYAYGAIGAWMYQTVAGLDLNPVVPGYSRLIIRPRPGGGLTSAKASLQTPYGLAESGWTLAGDLLTLTVTVPPNSSARVYVPAAAGAKITEGGKPASPVATEDSASVFEVGSGTYEFVAMKAQ